MTIEKISQSVVAFICRNMQVDDKMAEVYKYGVEITVSSLINFLLILISSMILDDLLAGIVFMTLFILLRSYTGGYHAETYLRCNIAFICTYLATYGIAQAVSGIEHNIVITVVMLVLAYIPIWIFAPVKNRHKYLSEEKIRFSRVVSAVVYFLSTLIAMILCVNNIWYGYLLAITDISISLLVMIEVFMQKKGYHPSGEEGRENKASEDDK